MVGSSQVLTFTTESNKLLKLFMQICEGFVFITVLIIQLQPWFCLHPDPCTRSFKTKGDVELHFALSFSFVKASTVFVYNLRWIALLHSSIFFLKYIPFHPFIIYATAAYPPGDSRKVLRRLYCVETVRMRVEKKEQKKEQREKKDEELNANIETWRLSEHAEVDAC